jgi:hypothetical protein
METLKPAGLLDLAAAGGYFIAQLVELTHFVCCRIAFFISGVIHMSLYPEKYIHTVPRSVFY